MAKMTRISPLPEPDPKLRLDIALLRVGEACAVWAERKIQQKVGLSIELWNGDGGLKEVVSRKLDELGVPREKLTPQLIAESFGIIEPKPKKIRRAG